MDVVRSMASRPRDPLRSDEQRCRRWRRHPWHRRHAGQDHEWRWHDEDRCGHGDGDERLDRGGRAGGLRGTHAESPTDSRSGAADLEVPGERPRLGKGHGGRRQEEPQDCGLESHQVTDVVAGFDWSGSDLFRDGVRGTGSRYSKDLGGWLHPDCTPTWPRWVQPLPVGDR